MSYKTNRVLKVLGLRYLQSFSAMRVTMRYLTSQEQLETQHICTWFYTNGTSRVQTRISLRRYLFTHFTGGDL